MGAMLLRHEPTSTSALRRKLADDLDGHGISGEIIDDVALVASELVGNAVRHAGIVERGELDVNWSIGADAVLISVEDPSEEPPVPRYPSPDAPSGRGLTIVDALSADWGVERTRRGKRVWAKVRTRSAS